ncbi:MAG: hypothetical protein HY075_16245 [Deltaproteobacteria bacterium]|nr:hypothetical protein [Deltaproteobacteria bacterium]
MAKPEEPDFSEDPADFSQTGDCPACKGSNLKLKDVNGIFICEKCASKRFSSKVRKSIQEAFDKQQQQAQRESWKRRIGIAKRAMALYEESKFPESLRTFREYIMILEKHHGVAPNGLTPALFDGTKEAGEILLIAGIYWDLSKIYDRMKGKTVEMRQALNKFYEFSADRPHLILASEAMRRYIASEKCVHKEEFKSTHTILRSRLAKCFIAGAVFGPASEEVETLRAFRDQALLSSVPGRALVATYYRVSPPIAVALARMPRAAAAGRVALGPLARALSKRYKKPRN